MTRTLRGICSSPLSSDDEDKAFPELNSSPAVLRKKIRPARVKRKPRAKRSIVQQKKLKTTPRKSTTELISEAPQDFVEYLSEQLSPLQQAKHEIEFNYAQGYIIKLPQFKSKQGDLEKWIQALGFFSSSSKQPNILCLSSLKVDIIVNEIKQRVPLPAAAMDSTMIRMNNYYKHLDSKEIEVVSPSRNQRLLHRLQHRRLETTTPVNRKDRRLARRLSKLERMTDRRLSFIVPSDATALPPVEVLIFGERNDLESLTPVKRDSHFRGQKQNFFFKRVLHLVLYSGYVDIRAYKEVLRKVSLMWEKVVIITDNLYTTDKLYRLHPRGHYLAEGAYKEVYKVFSEEKKRLEAVSVMDICDIGNQNFIRQEVAHSVLLSDATERGICPNFLQVFDVFLANKRPYPDRWGSKKHREPNELLRGEYNNYELESKQQQSLACDNQKQIFQYMRMEYCDGGDLEGFISLHENKTLPLNSVAVPFFFQMVFGLYCAREKYNLRHCDIKLLNFFLKTASRSKLCKTSGADVVLHYMLEDVCFVLQMPASYSFWIKLADYGAAVSNPESLGSPVTMDQFATLENSPVEYLLYGDAAKQSYAADTFSLGLCLLHLFTGSAPYEEVLEDVICPTDLLKDLKALWMSPRKKSRFSVIKSVARGDDEDTLCHTLYRYIVLFDLPNTNPNESCGMDKVWQLLLKHLRPEDLAVTRPQLRRKQAAIANDARTASEQFKYDQSLYSIAKGSNGIIDRCRQGLMAIPGAMDLLKNMVEFDPSKRLTLKQILFHSMFLNLRSSSLQEQVPADYVISYYKRHNKSSRILLDV
ncbi:hypothetical protein CCR75_008973 [Bremia lactucae]|uniref:Protein kinase domain-containing protein n=1 Tax=Bremia lactucae TaxID=4779 RepID=A0A976FE40_BRELC|nr:hypothetical protein CCR75_008973 [Bremia lactucae]